MVNHRGDLLSGLVPAHTKGKTMTSEPKPNGLEWGDKVKAIRTKLGLSQRAFALRLHVEPRTIQRWEAGETVPLPAIRNAVINASRQRGVIKAK